MKRALALARFELTLRPWPLVLGLGLSPLAFAAPWLPALQGHPAAQVCGDAAFIMFLVITPLTAVLLGAGTGAADRAGTARFFLARPLATATVTAVRLAIHLGLALGAGLLAALPAMVTGASTGLFELAGYLPWPLSLIPSPGAMLVLSLLLLLLLAEHFAAAAGDRSHRLALDIASLAVAAWLASSVSFVATYDSDAERLTAAALSVSLASLLAALLLAAATRLAIGRGDGQRGHVFGALAALAVLAPAALLARAWAGHVEARPRASEMTITDFAPSRFPGLVRIWGRTPLRLDLEVVTLFDLKGSDTPHLSVLRPSPSGSVGLGLHVDMSEGPAASILRRDPSGALVTTPLSIVLPEDMIALEIDDSGTRVALLTEEKRLELWDIAAHARIASSKVELPGAQNLDLLRLWVSPHGAMTAWSASDGDERQILACSLAPGQPLGCRKTVFDPHCEKAHPVRLPDAGLAISCGTDLVVIASDGAVAWRHNFSSGSGTDWWDDTAIEEIGLAPSGALAVRTEETLSFFATDGTIVGEQALPVSSWDMGWNASSVSICGWIAENELLLSWDRGEPHSWGSHYRNLGHYRSLVRMTSSGELQPVEVDWRCESTDLDARQPVALMDARGNAAVWLFGEAAPRTLPRRDAETRATGAVHTVP